MGFDKTRHQNRQVIRLWTDEMYNFFLIGNCLADVILGLAIITVFESWVNNPVLKIDQPFLLTEVLFFRKLKGCNEFFSPGGIWFYMFNFKGRLCLFVVGIAQCPA